MPDEEVNQGVGEKTEMDWSSIHKDEVTQFVRQFYQTSYDWRRQGYHSNWDTYERNFRNIYNPENKAKKAPWQSVMFIPETATKIETISAALAKISLGKKRPISLEPRESGDELQAELNSDLLDYYREKGGYELARYDAVKESTIFGSGFIKTFWEKKYAKRRIRENMVAGFKDQSEGQIPGSVKGYKEKVTTRLVSEGITYKCVHIRDVFPEPNDTTFDRLIHRDKITYGELVRMSDDGYIDKGIVEELGWKKEHDNFEEDVQPLKDEQNLTDPSLARSNYDKKYTVWEYWGPLPAKWIKLDMPENTEEEKKAASELVPGVAMIASGYYFLSSNENPSQDMRPPFEKIDYIRTGQTYGVGVAQLMAGLQDEINEVRNLRMDNVYLIMQKVFIGIEKYLVDSKELRMVPGGFIRLKNNVADLGDVQKAVSELKVSDMPLSAFRETSEIERQIQEVTAANRVTVGSAGLKDDTNRTLGGMELLRQAAFDRFMVYAYLHGRQCDVNIARKSMGLIYLNASDEAVRRILGEKPVEKTPRQFLPRYSLWKRVDPTEIDICYDYVPVDVFSMENRYVKSQDLSSKMQLMSSVLPQFNPIPGIRKLFQLSEFSGDEISEILEGLPDGPIPTPMGMGKGVPSIARPTKQATGEVAPMKMPANGGNGLAGPVG